MHEMYRPNSHPGKELPSSDHLSLSGNESLGESPDREESLTTCKSALVSLLIIWIDKVPTLVRMPHGAVRT
jgi:hypothetical protein